MNIAQLRTNRIEALRQRTACAFLPGLGYLRLGELPMPERPIYPPSACLPPQDTPDGTLVALVSRRGNRHLLRWLSESRMWEPLAPTAGNRMAWRPAYLAAHGWKLADG